MLKECNFKIGDHVNYYGMLTGVVTEINRCMGTSVKTPMGAIPNANYFMVYIKNSGNDNIHKFYDFDLDIDTDKMKQKIREKTLNTLLND